MIQKSASQKDQRKNCREKFPDSSSTRKTQAARILALLIRARGGWVPLPEILALGIAQYNTRLHELRAIGFDIQNRMETTADGTKRSFYRLLSSSSADVDMPGIRIAKPAPAGSSFDVPELTCEAPAPPPAPAAAPVLESASDPSPPAAPAPDAASDPDWYTRSTGKRRAAIERESLWLWESGR